MWEKDFGLLRCGLLDRGFSCHWMGLAWPDQREARTFWNMGRGILCCVSGHLVRETEKLHPTLGWHKGARRILIYCGAGAPYSREPGVFKGPILMESATGQRVASSRGLALLRSHSRCV